MSHHTTKIRYRSVTSSSSDSEESELIKPGSKHNRSLQNQSKRTRKICRCKYCGRRIQRSRNRSFMRRSESSASECCRNRRSSRSRSRSCQRNRKRRIIRSKSWSRDRSHRQCHRSKIDECRRRHRSEGRGRCRRYRSTSSSSTDDQSSKKCRKCQTECHEQRKRRSRSCERNHGCRESRQSSSRCDCNCTPVYKRRCSTSPDRLCTSCSRRRPESRTCEKSTQTDDYVDDEQLCFPADPFYQEVLADHNYSLPNLLPDLADYAFLDPLITDSLANSLSQIEWQNLDVSSNLNSSDASNQNVTNTLVAEIQPTRGSGMNMEIVTSNKEDSAIVANQQLNMICRVEVTRLPVDAKQLQKIMQTNNVKNINREWHSLSEKLDCKICGKCFNTQESLVGHYVILHPTAEVIPSRIPSNVAELLRSKSVHHCKRMRTQRNRCDAFEQICYFCNQVKSFSRYAWSNHLAAHTGCFQFPYCQGTSDNASDFEWADVRAVLCSLCNYVRFSETDMKNHLKNEHGRDDDATNNFEEVTFLRFLRQTRDRWRIPGELYARDNWFPQIKQLQDNTVIKNNNPDWHCLNKEMGCVFCRSKDSAVGHYCNVHPNNEVAISRLAPSVAKYLRSLKYAPKCKIFHESNHRFFEQNCHFCNTTKCFSRRDWINHMISHTGYYIRQCGKCSNMLLKAKCYRCEVKATETKNVHLFKGENLTGYLCDLCNFVRFSRTEMESHLRNEHDDNNGMDDFEEIIFLTFPDHGKLQFGSVKQQHAIQSDVADEQLPKEAVAGRKTA